MKIAVDTNVLARAVLQDDPQRGKAAAKLLEEATLIVVSLPSLCELVWVLRRGAKSPKTISPRQFAIFWPRRMCAMDRPAVDAGLAVLEAGGDFADGVIAHEGAWLGGETFVSFDRKATDLLNLQGRQTLLLS